MIDFDQMLNGSLLNAKSVGGDLSAVSCSVLDYLNVSTKEYWSLESVDPPPSKKEKNLRIYFLEMREI